MKQLFTFLVILFACSTSSAYVHSPAVSDLSASVNKQDSAKLSALTNSSDSIKIAALRVRHTYSLSLLAASNHSSGLKVPGSENNHTYGIKLSAAAGAKLSTAANHPDSIAQPISTSNLTISETTQGNPLLCSFNNYSGGIRMPASAINSASTRTLLAFPNNSGDMKITGAENNHVYGVQLAAAAIHSGSSTKDSTVTTEAVATNQVAPTNPVVTSNPPVVTTNPMVTNNSGNTVLFVPANHSEGIQTLSLENKYIYSVALPESSNHSGSLKIPGDENYNYSFNAVPKNLDTLRLLAFITHLKSQISIVAARRADSLRAIQIAHLDSLKQRLKGMDLGELKQTLKTNTFEPLRGPLYTEIALRYLDNNDTSKNKWERVDNQNEALNYTLKALHQYSSYSDTTGLLISFNNLARVYVAQKKYTEAKWFILQSNTMARTKSYVPGIISSLVTLSMIKIEIKDYSLAQRDLNEALQLSVANHYQKAQCDVLKTYALMYSRQKNYQKEAFYLKKRDSVLESIRKNDEARLAQLTAKDSVQTKKKVYISNTKKPSKGNSSKKTASL